MAKNKKTLMPKLSDSARRFLSLEAGLWEVDMEIVMASSETSRQTRRLAKAEKRQRTE